MKLSQNMNVFFNEIWYKKKLEFLQSFRDYNGNIHFNNGKVHYDNGNVHYDNGKVHYDYGKIRFHNGKCNRIRFKFKFIYNY